MCIITIISSNVATPWAYKTRTQTLLKKPLTITNYTNDFCTVAYAFGLRVLYLLQQNGRMAIQVKGIRWFAYMSIVWGACNDGDCASEQRFHGPSVSSCRFSTVRRHKLIIESSSNVQARNIVNGYYHALYCLRFICDNYH